MSLCAFYSSSNQFGETLPPECEVFVMTLGVRFYFFHHQNENSTNLDMPMSLPHAQNESTQFIANSETMSHYLLWKEGVSKSSQESAIQGRSSGEKLKQRLGKSAAYWLISLGLLNYLFLYSPSQPVPEWLYSQWNRHLIINQENVLTDTFTCWLDGSVLSWGSLFPGMSMFFSSWQKLTMKKDENTLQSLESILEVGSHAAVEVKQNISEDEPSAGEVT